MASRESERFLVPAEPDLSGVSYEALVREQLRRLGEDPTRQGLARTPERVAKSMAWLTRGYGMSVEGVIGEAVFEEPHHHMIVVKDIEMYSLCEHHLLPFFGKVHVAYIPNGRIVGLSKVPRIVDALQGEVKLARLVLYETPRNFVEYSGR